MREAESVKVIEGDEWRRLRARALQNGFNQVGMGGGVWFPGYWQQQDDNSCDSTASPKQHENNTPYTRIGF